MANAAAAVTVVEVKRAWVGPPLEYDDKETTLQTLANKVTEAVVAEVGEVAAKVVVLMLNREVANFQNGRITGRIANASTEEAVSIRLKGYKDLKKCKDEQKNTETLKVHAADLILYITEASRFFGCTQKTNEDIAAADGASSTEKATAEGKIVTSKATIASLHVEFGDIESQERKIVHRKKGEEKEVADLEKTVTPPIGIGTRMWNALFGDKKDDTTKASDGNTQTQAERDTEINRLKAQLASRDSAVNNSGAATPAASAQAGATTVAASPSSTTEDADATAAAVQDSGHRHSHSRSSSGGDQYADSEESTTTPTSATGKSKEDVSPTKGKPWQSRNQVFGRARNKPLDGHN